MDQPLAFKDIAMQVIGLMYEALNLNKKKINIIVATSGDTGSAAIAALREKKISTFLFYILMKKFLIFNEK